MAAKDSADIMFALRTTIGELEEEILSPSTRPEATELFKQRRHTLKAVLYFCEDARASRITIN